MISTNSKIKLALFDFGGVIAEEGFKDGLLSIGEANFIDPRTFYSAVVTIIADCGYLTGRADEKTFWREVRKQFTLRETDEELRGQIFSRFIIRGWMLGIVKQLRDQNIITAILSDQTDWLDLLNKNHDFFKYFDRVFNSFYLKQSKHDGGEIYDNVVDEMNISADAVLFVDDNENNVKKAAEKGLHTILYKDRESFGAELKRYLEVSI